MAGTKAGAGWELGDDADVPLPSSYSLAAPLGQMLAASEHPNGCREFLGASDGRAQGGLEGDEQPCNATGWAARMVPRVSYLPTATAALQTLPACPCIGPPLQPEQTADAQRLFKYWPTRKQSKAALKVMLFVQRREGLARRVACGRA